MDNSHKIKIIKLIHAIGLQYNLPDNTIREIVESQFEFTKEKIKEIDYDTLINAKDDLGSLKTTFLFKKLGKLFLSEKAVNSFLNREKNKNGRSK